MNDHTVVAIWVIKTFYIVLLFSCYLFLISSASVRSIPFLSFYVLIFVWNVPLVSPIFLKRSLVYPILLLSSVSLHVYLGRFSYLPLLFFGTLHSDGYIFPFLLCLLLLFFSQLFVRLLRQPCLPFFFLGMILITPSCTMLWTSAIFSQALSIRSNPLNLFVTSTV